MPRNIPLLIEYLAFFGLICCLIIYDTNVIFLSILILFVTCETLMEVFKIRLKQQVSHVYTALFILSSFITTLMYNGMYVSSIFPVFFIVVLLIVSQYIYKPKYQKKEDGAIKVG
ncbi:hypothetical protein QUF88_14010 [Bacillus sp. DX1.1]|uniref:hypothetical protein n=1 Tax=unclassified Bacillus (in: firmicutes) TaxID=185979 RepID=UPI0025709122|nr:MULTISPECIES: hypothetical protein [unclassified Bacillus (in: firmicutes)]MDM5154894.1 hypothetical protein [Bacillus sp. DX1.1]WJE83765.1 hypothetical protein QRE67_11505 [Bacillus sp. DX3.1]